MFNHLPSLNSLRAFEAVARHLSFADAANELSVTPAAISHQIKLLEDILGMKFFHRHNRSISLTDAGQALLPDITKGFDHMLKGIAALEKSDNHTVLVISAGPAFSAKWLVPRLHTFLRLYPEIDPRISANIDRSNFRADGVDVAIRFGTGNTPGLYVEPLIEELLVPLCSPSYRDELNLGDPSNLKHATLIHDDSMRFLPNAPSWETVAKLMNISELDTSHGLRFNYADHPLDAAVEGVGITLGRLILAAGDLRSGRLVRPFDLVIKTGYKFYIVFPEAAKEKSKIILFRQWLDDEIRKFYHEFADDFDV